MGKIVTSYKSGYPSNIRNKRMPTIGGVLNLISGVLGIINCILFFVLAPFIQREFAAHPAFVANPEFLSIFATVFRITGIVLLIPCAFSIIGGIFAMRRKHWGWALASSICSVSVNIFGTIAIVFVFMSRTEFAGQGPESTNSDGAGVTSPPNSVHCHLPS